jgi:hypothetical protein
LIIGSARASADFPIVVHKPPAGAVVVELSGTDDEDPGVVVGAV